MEEDIKIIFNGKEVKDLRNERVFLELEDSTERTEVDLTEIQKLLEIQKLPKGSPISGTIHLKKNTENYRNMQEFFEDCKARVLLETWRKLKE